MIVVDVNVLVHLHMPGKESAAAEALLESDSEWVAPVLWRSEFRNALAGYLRRGELTLKSACLIQHEAEVLMSEGEYDVDSLRVLELADRSACTACDCEYVALAQRLGCRLVTRDEQILQTFPEVAVSL